jgi:hypothetical protein
MCESQKVFDLLFNYKVLNLNAVLLIHICRQIFKANDVSKDEPRLLRLRVSLLTLLFPGDSQRLEVLDKL